MLLDPPKVLSSPDAIRLPDDPDLPPYFNASSGPVPVFRDGKRVATIPPMCSLRFAKDWDGNDRYMVSEPGTFIKSCRVEGELGPQLMASAIDGGTLRGNYFESAEPFRETMPFWLQLLIGVGIAALMLVFILLGMGADHLFQTFQLR